MIGSLVDMHLANDIGIAAVFLSVTAGILAGCAKPLVKTNPVRAFKLVGISALIWSLGLFLAGVNVGYGLGG